jgi:hypothetical protein
MRFDALHPESMPLDFLEFANHCELLSEGRLLPRQQDFSVADVPWLYGRMYEVDVLDIGPDFYFRTFGIFWQAVYGADFTGRWLSEIELQTDKLDALRMQYDHVVTTRGPVTCRTRLLWPDAAEITVERLLVPFTLDGETVSQIVVAAHYDAEVEDLVFFRGEGLPQVCIEGLEPIQLSLAS